MTRTFKDWQDRARKGGIVPKIRPQEIPECFLCYDTRRIVDEIGDITPCPRCSKESTIYTISTKDENA